MKPSLIKALGFVVVCGTASAQSLWNPQRPAPSLFADTIARAVGDTLMITINESQTVTNKESTELKKSSDLASALSNFDIKPNAFKTLPGVAGNDKQDFTGDAKYDKAGTFQTKIGVTVIDVQPNGNLVVEGHREIKIDKETKTIRITGIVRPYDISSANVISSESVGNASIAYEGDGALTRATNRGWLGDLLDFVWPF